MKNSKKSTGVNSKLDKGQRNYAKSSEKKINDESAYVEETEEGRFKNENKGAKKNGDFYNSYEDKA